MCSIFNNHLFFHMVERLVSHSIDSFSLCAASFWNPAPGNQLGVYFYQQFNPPCDLPLNQISLALCPEFTGCIHVFPSATSLYYAPSDKSGIWGMYQERIHAVKSWRKGPAHNNCVFVEQNAKEPGFWGLFVAQVCAFLAITHNRNTITCTIVSEFSTIGNQFCPGTGMWMVKLDYLWGVCCLNHSPWFNFVQGALNGYCWQGIYP